MQTCVALCLTMREISDAVAFMCILRFFKRVDPATAMAGVQSQPFSLTLHMLWERSKKGVLSVSILHRVFEKKSSPFHLVHSCVAQMTFFWNIGHCILCPGLVGFSLLGRFLVKSNEMQHLQSVYKYLVLLRLFQGSEDLHPRLPWIPLNTLDSSRWPWYEKYLLNMSTLYKTVLWFTNSLCTHTWQKTISLKYNT